MMSSVIIWFERFSFDVKFMFDWRQDNWCNDVFFIVRTKLSQLDCCIFQLKMFKKWVQNLKFRFVPGVLVFVFLSLLVYQRTSPRWPAVLPLQYRFGSFQQRPFWLPMTLKFVYSGQLLVLQGSGPWEILVLMEFISWISSMVIKFIS